MRLAAVVLNIILFAFLCVVLVVDGFPKELSYIAFTLFALLTLAFNAIVISRVAMGPTSAVMTNVAILCNVVFLIRSVWAFIQQYPHPKEDGFVAFIVLMATTPIFSIFVLARSGAGPGWMALGTRSTTSSAAR